MALVLPAGVTAPTPTRRTPRHAIVASGARIKLDDQDELARYRRRQAASWWQQRAWMYHFEIPELYFAHILRRNCLSRVRLVPAIESDDPEAPPVPLDDETTPDGLDPDLCTQVLDRLRPWPTLMGQVGLAWDISGECHVALIPDDDAITGERCRVLSTYELEVKGDGYHVKDDPSDQTGTLLPSDIPLFRLWQPDGQYAALPMSPMRPLLVIAQELMLYTQALMGVAKSRIAMNGGILWVSDDVSFEPYADTAKTSTEDAGDGEGRDDPFIDDLMDAGMTAIADPESAGAALPIIMRSAGKPDDSIKHIDIARPLEDQLVKIRAELLGRLANGVDLPREFVLGVGDSNHWNAEQIKQQLWHDHLEPTTLGIVSSITDAFYRPQLVALGVDPEIARRCCVWYDPSWFLGSPDLADTADEGFGLYALSWETWRRVKGYSEDDAPTSEEIDYRVSIKQREKVTIREVGTAPVDAVEPATEATTETPAPVDPQVKIPDTPNSNGKAAQVASGGPPPLDRLGGRIVNIERDLRTRLLQLADAAMGRALERAGMKVLGKLRGRTNGQAMKVMLAQVEEHPVTEGPSILGRAAVLSLGLEDETLLAGALGDLEQRYHFHVRRAQHAAARAAAAAASNDIDLDALDTQTEDHRNAGWVLFSTGLLALAHGLLYDPHPDAPPVGEFDESTLVPPGLVRNALDVAGGSNGPDAPPSGDARPAGGGATGGPSMLDEFKAQLGIVDDTYTWVYGDAPRVAFLPHLDLDGVTFTSWDDDVLASTENFPPVDYLAPGDHSGCECSVSVSFSQAPTDEGTTEEAA